MKKKVENEYTAEDFFLHRIEENQFIHSIACDHTPVSEISRFSELTNDKEVYERLRARCKIERLRHANKKRRNNLQSLCSKGELSSELTMHLQATFAKYIKRMLEQIQREEKYNSKYEFLYYGSAEELNTIQELVNKSFPQIHFHQEKKAILPYEVKPMLDSDTITEDNIAIECDFSNDSLDKLKSIILGVRGSSWGKHPYSCWKHVYDQLVDSGLITGEIQTSLSENCILSQISGIKIVGKVSIPTNENYSEHSLRNQSFVALFEKIYQACINNSIAEYVNVSNVNKDNPDDITSSEQYTSIEDNNTEINMIESTSIGANLSEQIDKIEDFVRCYPPDKNDGRYSKRLKTAIAHKLIDSGLISNVAFGKRGSEYIAWIPSIDIIGYSSDDSKDAVAALGKKIVVACRQGLKNYYKKGSQFSGVLYGEDYSLLTSDKKYAALIEVLKDALAPVAKTVQAGRATMVLKRLYDLNIIDSPVDSFARGDQYVARIPGIEIEGVSYSTGSITHVKNAANKDLVEKILRHHKDGSLRGVISASFFGTMNEDWLLSKDDSQNETHHDTGGGTDDNDAPKNTTTKETKNTIQKPTINTTVKLSQLDFSFEEKDDDDDLNF